jgi:dihydroflavonol-4-reductase
MRILVTGGTGFIGSHTVHALRNAGHDVRLLVRNEAKARSLWSEHPEVLEDLVVGQITSGPATVDALRECDGIVHTAAPVALAASRSEARRVTNENLRSVRLLIERAVDDGLERIVHLSSVAVFDTAGLERADESCPIHVKGDAYARSKSAPERFVRDLQDRGALISITYPTSVLGPADPGLSEAMRGIVGMMKSGVMVTSSGFQLIDVRDCAEVHEQLISREPRAGRYLLTAPYLPWEQLAELLDQSAGVRLPRLNLPGSLVRAVGVVSDRLRWLADIDPMMSREATRLATQWVAFDASAVERDLGFTFRDPIATLKDTIRFLAEAGHIDKERALRFTHPGRGRQ